MCKFMIALALLVLAIPTAGRAQTRGVVPAINPHPTTARDSAFNRIVQNDHLLQRYTARQADAQAKHDHERANVYGDLVFERTLKLIALERMVWCMEDTPEARRRLRAMLLEAETGLTLPMMASMDHAAHEKGCKN